MQDSGKIISRLLRIPGVLNWARQNYKRTDDTREALEKLVQADLQISLNPIYAICAKLAYRELSYDEALEKVGRYKGKFHRKAGEEILPLFQDYLLKNQAQGLQDFRRLRIPFPIGKSPEGKVTAVPVKPSFVTIREGRLLPVFLLGWVNSPLSYYQCRLISAVIRRALLTQQDFLGSDAEIVTFSRRKGTDVRYQGGWMVSEFDDFSTDELAAQIATYNRALEQTIEKYRA